MWLQQSIESRRWPAALLGLGLLAVSFVDAGASLRSAPVKMKLEGGPRVAQTGVPFEDVLTLRSARASTVRDLRLEGRGWQVRFDRAVDEIRLGAGESFEIPFEATPLDPSVPLRLHWEVDGQRFERELDLSPRRMSERYERVLIGDATPFVEAAKRGELTLSPDDPRLRLDDDVEAPVQSSLSKAGPDDITVTGRVTYRDLHDGGSQERVGVQNAFVQLFLHPSDPPDGFWFPGIVATTTDLDGNFQFVIGPPEPGTTWNLSLNVSAETGKVLVQKDNLLEDEWDFAGPWVYGVGPGDTVDYGTFEPRREKDHPAFHILNTIERTRAYLDQVVGMAPPYVEVQWPERDSDGAFYTPYWQEIHISRAREWRESTIAHEYGHHWLENFGAQPDHDYCNGACDGGEGCGHCLWCGENEIVAWNEGVADFVSQLATNYLLNVYPTPSTVIAYDFQNVFCGDGCPTGCDPEITEGYFAALLYDLIDQGDSFDEDDENGPDVRDVLGGLTQEVFTTLTTSCSTTGHLPGTPRDFIDCFIENYPDLRPGFWETAFNCNFVTDVDPPPAPTTVVSSTHQPNVPSPRATVLVTWEPPVDDVSGVNGYDWRFNSAFPLAPGLTSKGSGNAAKSEALTPGTWYLTVRARDRAGNWSPDYATFGPYVIEPADGENLLPQLRAGWEYPLVPRRDATATTTSAEVSGSLTGGEPQTWWSVAGRNDGDVATASTSKVALYVDGVQIDEAGFAYLGPGASNAQVNLGPVNVPGGRHTLGMLLDSDEILSEQEESDNVFAHQWVWTPMTFDSFTTALAPPAKDGGFDWIPLGTPAAYNCHGFEMQTHIGWSMIALAAFVEGTDYDLKLFDGYALPDNGFENPQAVSARPADHLEALLVNFPEDGFEVRNFGVYNQTGDSPYEMEQVDATPVSIGHDESVTWQTGDLYELRSYYASTEAERAITIEVENAPWASKIQVAFFGAGTTRGGILDADDIWSIRAGRNERRDVVVPAGETGAILVFRDPVDGFALAQFDLRIAATPPDLAADTPFTWEGVIVPQIDATIPYPFNIVPAPTALYGNSMSTYLYMFEKNASGAPTADYRYEIDLDGEILTYFDRPALSGDQTRTFRGASPFIFPHGRHTLGIDLDSQDEVAEGDETNNGYGRQWVWSPATLPLDTLITVASLPDPTGGLTSITDGLGFYNAHGMRTPFYAPATGLWAAVYAVGESRTDVDLRLHTALDNPSLAMTAPQEGSYVDGDEAELVLLNFQQMSYDRFDVGMVRAAGSDGAMVQTVGSTILPSGSTAHGPFAMEADDMVDLYDLQLTSGVWRISVVPEDPSEEVDLGLSIHAGTDPYRNRVQTIEGGASWQASGGQVESTLAEVGVGGNHAIAVWRVSDEDRSQSAEYRLVIEATGATGVPDDAPPVHATRLVSVVPNPFNPQTTLSFELRTAGLVQLDVFNLRGERVVTLARRHFAAGRHELVWNGRDAHGNRVASGRYTAVLDADGQRSRMGMTLVK